MPKRIVPGSSYSLTFIFTIVNVAIFLVFFLASYLLSFTGNISASETLIRFIAVSPEWFVRGYFWTLVTSMFLHGSFLHLMVNMVSFFFLGTFVERLIGKKRFFWFYMLSGLIAGLFFVLFAYLGTYFSNGTAWFGSISDYAVGASGALFGLGGLLAVLLPNLRVLVFFIIPMRLWLAMTVLLVGFWAMSIGADLPVGNTAHFGGLVAGLVYGFYLRTKYSKKVDMLNRMFK